ncbi:hypothetical protein ONZ43_g2526 [Nemania bipapillata]|uniref:Uncharacterized protein n=1 Tax=Nemania bipapillata TaxID=110536 RepID=A0ACC2J0A3_9PEZI|nr:hypothetical protein ONZ43_g2526 [Nemania bipapillata]
MTLIILISSLDQPSDLEEHRSKAQNAILSKHFPEAQIITINCFGKNDETLTTDYFHRRALAVMEDLQQFAEASFDEDMKEPVIFITRGTGGSLAKQILIMALEDRRYYWLAFSTLALYFIDDFAYTKRDEKELSLFHLLYKVENPATSLPRVIMALSGTMTFIEAQFSALFSAFHITYHISKPNPTLESD